MAGGKWTMGSLSTVIRKAGASSTILASKASAKKAFPTRGASKVYTPPRSKPYLTRSAYAANDATAPPIECPTTYTGRPLPGPHPISSNKNFTFSSTPTKSSKKPPATRQPGQSQSNGSGTGRHSASVSKFESRSVPRADKKHEFESGSGPSNLPRLTKVWLRSLWSSECTKRHVPRASCVPDSMHGWQAQCRMAFIGPQ
mmetsp:Transcript_108222/g.303144  ORF Transcript_108222/g.303144 Transcript_108222/m.303144 type:complete len:200 (+) Transcript_108222:565-1164(+)